MSRAASCFLAFLYLAAAPVRAAERPNIVLILADDLGWADLGVYGSDLHETPNLDRFASSAVRFTDAYAAAPVCSPTRASIQTGKTPARLHLTIWREATLRPPPERKLIHAPAVSDLPHEEVTIAEALKAAGYLTAHVGKWHLGGAGHYPETQGYDVNVGGSLWGAPQTFFFPYRGTKHFGGEPRYIPGLDWGREGEYLTDRLTDEALKIIDRAGGRPFFLNLCYHTVHTPIEAKREAVEKYRAKIRPGLHHRNPVYAAMVESLDENVGRVLAKLDERGIAGETVVIFTSDNGGYIGRYEGRQVTDNYPLRSGKGSLYEGGIRVPLIVRWPGVTKPGGVCREPVSTIDFYPTLLEIAGVEGDAKHNEQVEGLSLAGLLRNPGAKLEREALYFHYPHYYATTTPVSAIRSGNWKLLEYFEDGRIELYDLSRDLGERKDLAEVRRDVALRLRDRLARWRAEVGAQMPQPNPRWGR